MSVVDLLESHHLVSARYCDMPLSFWHEVLDSIDVSDFTQSEVSPQIERITIRENKSNVTLEFFGSFIITILKFFING
jgi:hypothetical protein